MSDEARLRERLREIAAAATAIADGDRARSLGDDDDPEISTLVGSIRRIADILGRHERLLGENIQSLQNVNRELRETREGLVRSEKLATIGRLSAGVAHEIGNPLGAILGYLDMLQRTDGLPADIRDWLSRMENESRRIDAIIRELLDFARPAATALSAVDVNETVSSAVSLLSHQKMFAKVRLEQDLAKPLPLALAERHRLRQVIVNLMMNASDAMHSGGSIRVATQLVTSASEPPRGGAKLAPRRRDDPPQVDFSHLRPTIDYDPTAEITLESRPTWIRIAVADDGRGIPPEELPTVFDPFFTTKPVGKGTGLGLAIALSTIRSFNGRIHIESRLDVGTTVTIELQPAE